MIKGINTFGGEALTRAPEGCIVGALIGFGLGVFAVPWWLATNEFQSISTMIKDSAEAPYFSCFLTIFFSVVGCAIAGTAIGIGVPKSNPQPQQGLLRNHETHHGRHE